jgi:hypothetical protein
MLYVSKIRLLGGKEIQGLSSLTSSKANQEFDMDFEAFTILQSSESFQTSDIMNAELDTSVTGQVDIFLRSEFNTTPVSERSTTFMSTWGGSYSLVLHNVPWFRFQRQIKTIG